MRPRIAEIGASAKILEETEYEANEAGYINANEYEDGLREKNLIEK